eukprot:TRINITY_DN1106_c1_g2_i2.p1 TRINITY_DN1106_c1_g2~~TRINITY_DN1106_c1_g2_i2.p1  ORF type:complete len:461 (+),score=71.48 TRINITY_DN1106_c1_g2_i2:888-2270(+)
MRQPSVPAEAPQPYQKSIVVTYVLWLVGWWCGLHHWYLEREGQAMLWMTSLGGFGVGSALDFFLIPGYVREANGSFYKGDRGFGFFAFLAYLLFSTYYAWLLDFAGEWPAYGIANVLSLAALTFGRKTIGVPTYKGVGWLIITQLLMMQDTTGELIYHAQSFVRRFFAICQTTRSDSVPSVGRKSTPVRLFLFIATAATIVVTSHYIEFEYDGKQTNLAQSAVSSGKILKQVFDELYKMGWQESFSSVYGMVQGEEKKALETLNLQKGATPQEIKKAWKKMTIEFHPDRNPDAPPNKMNEINQAYEILNRIYKLRGGKSDDEESQGRRTAEPREGSPHYARKQHDPSKSGFTFSFGTGGAKMPDEQPVKREEPIITEEEYTAKLKKWTKKANKTSKNGRVYGEDWYEVMKLTDVVSVLMGRSAREKDAAFKKETETLIEYLRKAAKQREPDVEDVEGEEF